MNSRYDKPFHQEIVHLMGLLRPKYTQQDIALVLHVRPSLFSKWLRGLGTPIWLARQATVSIMRELTKPFIA